MNKLLLLLLFTLGAFASPHEGLVHYQNHYSTCHGKTNYQIANCLLNGGLNYANFRGDKSSFRHISTKKIAQAVRRGDIYHFTMSHMPKTRRYRGLKAYTDFLYSLRQNYRTPAFKGNEEEDTLRIKLILNMLQDSDLVLDSIRGPRFEEEVKEYQRRNGLSIDGDIGPQTKRTFQQTLRQIRTRIKKNLTLERISTPKPSEYILVNIPEFMMHYYKDYQPELSMRVVVGKTKMRTPIFNRKLKYIVKNPRWNVPPVLYQKEYAHMSREALKRKGFAFNAEGKMYQKSGPRNALGKVKFLFPNRFNVYMHDTPSKHLFNNRKRAYSHGCIRLQKPMALLNALGYDYSGTKNKWISLKQKVPVFIEYHTVWVDDEGIVQFRPDIYGYEKKLFR